MRKILDYFHGEHGNERFHRIMKWFWVANLPVALLTGLKTSLPYLVAISIWALIAGEAAAEEGSRGNR